ncbi:hypothetical protein LTR09_000362 [Extremus antarcticus]|uniref:Methyltransferase type 11 domain-containing protein n=1 Tax=Extremus antarcticus TaxID=702011 RepID=A0AAJ0LX94_9PEZI|nr:hypothetical protein LTR09_000362 [Extremus antarcticus]
MVRIATLLGGKARLAPIEFMQGDAEDCSSIPDQSVDLITAATAAHWFDMERFWPTTARVLKPGGTVAISTIWRIYVHPGLTSHAEELQKILVELEQGTLGPYQKPGNWSLMGLYEDLQMPWSLANACDSFAEKSYSRQIWTQHGLPEADGSYVCGVRLLTLDETEKSIATISAVTRWREAHLELANTGNDCVTAAFTKIKNILRGDANTRVTMVGPTVLVTLKRSK